MRSLKVSMFFLFPLSLLSFQFRLTTATDPAYVYLFCSNTNFTRNSTYQSNLNLLLSSLSSNANRSNGFSSGFFNASAGQDPDRVHGLFQCRGDQTTSSCRDCVNFATTDVIQRCPVGKGAIIWFAECLLRYSDQYFFSTMTTNPSVLLRNTQNITDQGWFHVLLGSLMNEAITRAVNNSELFATAKPNFNSFQAVYVLVQCTQDVSDRDCNACLRQALPQLPSGWRGGRVLFPSCNARYEIYPFYNVSAVAAPPRAPVLLSTPPLVSVTTPRGGKRKKEAWIAIGTSVSAIMVVVLFGSFIWYKRRRNKAKKANRLAALIFGSNSKEGRTGDDYSYDILGEKREKSQELPLFPLGLVLEATRHFSDENKLGEGGFGPVFKVLIR